MKLYYFPVSGRAEWIKLILEEREYKYEFVGVPFGEHTKLATPYDQLPMLEDGDLKLAQTGTIARYVAKKVGLYPISLKESSRCDMVFDGTMDFLGKYFGLVIYKNLNKEDYEKAAKQWFTYFENIVKGYKEGKEWIVSQFSFADLALFQAATLAAGSIPKFLDDFPLIKAHHERVGARPNIKAYLNSNRRAK